MRRRRIVITGIGVICSAGEDTLTFRKTLQQGRSALTPIRDPRIEQYGTLHAGCIDEAIIGQLDLSEEDRYIRLADRATREAIQRSGIVPGTYGARAGFFLGTCSGPMLTIETIYRDCDISGQVADRGLLSYKQYYRGARLLAGRYDVHGPVYTVTTACSAFCAALTTAADMMRCGMIDLALVGGADALSLTTLAGFVGLKAVSAEPCAPFSLPVGLNLGEGAAVVVLEELGGARKRGAPVMAEVEGFGLSNDAWHCSAPDPTGKGATAAMKAAITDAGISPDEISYINAHGTGTEANDKAETKAIRRLFGTARDLPPVSSTKAVVGHCLGAAGAIETVATLLCGEAGILPKSVNYSDRREGCTLPPVIDTAAVWQPGTRWLKNNFAFGGNNASICIKNGAPDDSTQPLEECPDEPVVISATGILSAAGIAPSEPAGAYFEKTCDVTAREIPVFGRWNVAGVPEFENSTIDRRFSGRGMDRAGLLATAAATLALKNGRVPDRPSVRSKVGFFMSIAQGSSWAEREHIGRLFENNFHIDKINAFPYIVPNAVTGTVARALMLSGCNNTFCNGPGASVAGFVAGWTAVKNGHADMLLCGSVDDCSEAGLYDCAAAECPGGDMPVLGEGAVMLLLEPQSRAEKRGITPVGRVLAVDYTTVPPEQSDAHLVSFIEAMLSRQHIDENGEIGLCITDMQNRLTGSLQEFRRPVSVIDQTPINGWMVASQPLYNAVAGLVKGSIGRKKCTKYILIIFRLPQGNTTVTLLEKGAIRKSDRAND